MTNTAGEKNSQRGRSFNHLLIFMCRIQVKSGTRLHTRRENQLIMRGLFGRLGRLTAAADAAQAFVDPVVLDLHFFERLCSGLIDSGGLVTLGRERLGLTIIAGLAVRL